MSKIAESYLSKRQQQIMEVIYRCGSVDVATAMEELAQPPTNPALRAQLRTLEEAGYLRHTDEGGKYIYHPTQRRQTAARHALSRLLRTFFDNSVEQAMETLLSVQSSELTDEELDRLQAMIEQARDANNQNRPAGDRRPTADR